jgi:hypothetical protein
MDDTDLINEVLELTLAWQRGDATAEERARLERLLLDNPQAILWYLRIVDDSLTLLDAASANESIAPATCELEQVVTDDLVTPYKSEPSYWVLAGHRPRWYLALSFVACALLLTFAAFRSDRFVDHAPTSNVAATNAGSARVVDISNVAWAEGAQQFVEWSLVKPGDTLRFQSGWINLFFDNGAELLIEGPADVEFVTSQKVFARQGKLAARIGPEAVGFRIDTPHAKVIDRGTAFGVSVDGNSHTSVVVYEGIVDLDVVGDSKLPRRRLATGEALSVNRQGKLSRITTVGTAEFLEPPKVRVLGEQSNRLITSVSDNVRSLQTAKYYRIIPNGFTEDCRAFVDRLHEWNGMDVRGLPPFLVGGDYVMTFNDDKLTKGVAIAVDISQPCNFYVLIDDRLPLPEWLKQDFVDTNWDVGCDEGWEDKKLEVALGAGQSVDHSFSVWRRIIRQPTTVLLGSLNQEPPPPGVKADWSMYGIVVTPLQGDRNID